MLFNLYNEYLVKDEIGEENAIKVNDININHISFADAAALISESEVDRQDLLNRIAIACNEYEMALSVKKTKVMVISKEKDIAVMSMKINLNSYKSTYILAVGSQNLVIVIRLRPE